MKSERFVITDNVWEKIWRHLPGKATDRGVTAADNRLFLEAVLWRVRAGSPWRDLPPAFGNWNSVFQRFRRWAKKGARTRREPFGATVDHCDGAVDVTNIFGRLDAAGIDRGEIEQAHRDCTRLHKPRRVVVWETFRHGGGRYVDDCGMDRNWCRCSFCDARRHRKFGPTGASPADVSSDDCGDDLFLFGGLSDDFDDFSCDWGSQRIFTGRTKLPVARLSVYRAPYTPNRPIYCQ